MEVDEFLRLSEVRAIGYTLKAEYAGEEVEGKVAEIKSHPHPDGGRYYSLILEDRTIAVRPDEILEVKENGYHKPKEIELEYSDEQVSEPKFLIKAGGRKVVFPVSEKEKLIEELQNTDTFREYDSDYDMQDMAEMLAREHPAIEEDDLTIANHQLTKAALIKMVMWEKYRKRRNKNAARDTR